MTRLLMVAVLTGTTLLGGAASALDAQDVAARLVADPVLVDPRSGIRIDEPAVQQAFEGLPVPTYALVVPQRDVDEGDGGIDGVLLSVVAALEDPRAVVVVVTDDGELQAGEGGASGVPASALLDRIVQDRSDQAFSGQALTAALLAFAEGVAQESGATADDGPDRQSLGVASLMVVALVVGGVLWMRTQRQVRHDAPLSDADADAEAVGRGGW